jgi:lysophospholipase L1-like esterase
MAYLPTWAQPEPFTPSVADWNAVGIDWNSLVRGDLTSADWASQYPSDAVPAVAVASSIGAPDGVGTQTAAFHVNATGTASGRGLLSRRFVSHATGTATASVVAELPPAIGSGTMVLAITDGAATPTVLASTLCVLTGGEQLFEVDYASALGNTEYTVTLGFNWTAEGGSAQCRAYVSKVRVNTSNGAGLFAADFVRYDRDATGVRWGNDSPRNGVTNSELVLDVSTRAVGIEWIDSAIGGFGASPGEEDAGFFTGVATGSTPPTTFVSRLVSLSAQYGKYRISRVAAGAGGRTRISARSSQMATVSALYVPAATDVATVAMPTARIVCYGDSMTAGRIPAPTIAAYGPGYAVRESWPNLLRTVFSGPVFAEAIGGRALMDSDGYLTVGGVFTPNATLRGNFRAGMIALAPTIIIIAIGTNDWGPASGNRSAANFRISLDNLVDDMRADHPAALIYVFSPAFRNSETVPNGSGSTLPNFRTEGLGCVTARSGWAIPPVYWDGNDATITGDGSLPDGTHKDREREAATFAFVRTQLGL